jgi:hypothetical protein
MTLDEDAAQARRAALGYDRTRLPVQPAAGAGKLLVRVVCAECGGNKTLAEVRAHQRTPGRMYFRSFGRETDRRIALRGGQTIWAEQWSNGEPPVFCRRHGWRNLTWDEIRDAVTRAPATLRR